MSGRGEAIKPSCVRPALGPPWGLRPRGSHTLGPVEGVGIQAEKQEFFCLFSSGVSVFSLDTSATFPPVVSNSCGLQKAFFLWMSLMVWCIYICKTDDPQGKLHALPVFSRWFPLKAQPSVALSQPEASCLSQLQLTAFIFLLVYLCWWCSCSVVSEPTLATPWTVACKAPLSMGFICARLGLWYFLKGFGVSSHV